MPPTKVLFLTLNTFSLTGGIEKVCCSLAKVLNDLNDEFKNFSFNLFSMYDQDSEIDTRYLQKKNFNGFQNEKLRFGFSAVIKGRAADTVILSHINLLLFAWIIKKISPSTKVILFAHGIEVWRPLASWKKKFLQQDVELWAVSKFTANTLVEMHQIGPEKITIVNNSLDPYFQFPSYFEKPEKLLARYQLSKDQPILFTLTRLSSKETYKGYDRVFYAMPSLLEKFPNLHYVLAGKSDHEELNRVNKLIEKLNLTHHVTLAGFLSDDELSDHFNLGNVFVMPSTMEGFGIVFIEAAACGSKIVAGNADGSVDALLNGQLGTLVDPSNVDDISAAISYNLELNVNPKHLQEQCIASFGYESYYKKLKKLILPNANKAT